jgi:hypothetical protein
MMMTAFLLCIYVGSSPYVLGIVTAGLWVVLLVLFLKTRRT